MHVFDTGRLNSAGGPDFHRARISIGERMLTGDVEIHRTAADWMRHRHQTDPRYNSVILHVVLEGKADETMAVTQCGRAVPTLVLGAHLSKPLRSLWMEAVSVERTRRSSHIPCALVNDGVGVDVIAHWLRKLALERLELKLRRFEERLHELARERHQAVKEAPRTWGTPPIQGEEDEIPPPIPEPTARDLADRRIWEQMLYEGIMEALGYGGNRDSFVRLARGMTLERIREWKLDADLVRLQAAMLGVAGLIPKVGAVPEKESRAVVRTLTCAWREIRKVYRSDRLQASDWQFFPTCPSNFPTIRIAAASHIALRILRHDAFRSLMTEMKTEQSAGRLRERIRCLLEVRMAGYWERHYSFVAVNARPVQALGAGRIHAIAVNVFVPFCALYARVFKDPLIRQNVIDLYSSLPPLEENTILRRMEAQLLKGKYSPAGAGDQQGLLQLHNCYCKECRCGECEIGAAVSQWVNV